MWMGQQICRYCCVLMQKSQKGKSLPIDQASEIRASPPRLKRQQSQAGLQLLHAVPQTYVVCLRIVDTSRSKRSRTKKRAQPEADNWWSKRWWLWVVERSERVSGAGAPERAQWGAAGETTVTMAGLGGTRERAGPPERTWRRWGGDSGGRRDEDEDAQQCIHRIRPLRFVLSRKRPTFWSQLLPVVHSWPSQEHRTAEIKGVDVDERAAIFAPSVNTSK
jgi:hypothetical protein